MEMIMKNKIITLTAARGTALCDVQIRTLFSPEVRQALANAKIKVVVRGGLHDVGDTLDMLQGGIFVNDKNRLVFRANAFHHMKKDDWLSAVGQTEIRIPRGATLILEGRLLENDNTRLDLIMLNKKQIESRFSLETPPDVSNQKLTISRDEQDLVTRGQKPRNSLELRVCQRIVYAISRRYSRSGSSYVIETQLQETYGGKNAYSLWDQHMQWLNNLLDEIQIVKSAKKRKGFLNAFLHYLSYSEAGQKLVRETLAGQYFQIFAQKLLK